MLEDVRPRGAYVLHVLQEPGFIVTEIVRPDTAPFDAIRRLTHAGAEYWSARDLMPLLGYERWESFEDAIERGRAAADGSSAAAVARAESRSSTAAASSRSAAA